MNITEVLNEIHDAMGSVTLPDMASAFIDILPFIIIGILLNVIIDKI